MAELVIISTSGPNGDPICALCGEPIIQHLDRPTWANGQHLSPKGVVHQNCYFAVQTLECKSGRWQPGWLEFMTNVMLRTPTEAYVEAFAEFAVEMANQMEAQIAAEQTRKKAIADFRLKPARIIQPAASHRESD